MGQRRDAVLDGFQAHAAGNRALPPMLGSGARTPLYRGAESCYGVGFNQSLPGVNAMGFFTKSIQTLDDLFVHTLQDIYYAENQIAKSLPLMIDKAGDPQLKQAFQIHLTETQNQIKRLEQVFRMHGQEPKGTSCPAIDGVVEEANEIMGDVKDAQVLDAALLASAQAVEHYEITRYGTLVAWAKQLGREDCASLLHQNLEEEKATDEKLTVLAKSNLNRKAA